MSALYLVDLFTDNLIDRRTLFPGGTTPLTGFYGVQVPDGINVGTPPDVSSLITAKYAGIQNLFSYLTNIVYDATFANVDLANSNSVQPTVNFGAGLVPPASGSAVAQTPPSSLLSTPSQAVIVFDTFYFTDQDVAAGRFTRNYVLPGVSDPEGVVACSVSFDNGSTFISAATSSVFSIPAPSQGNTLIVKFTRSTGTNRLFIGSWAVLYQ